MHHHKGCLERAQAVRSRAFKQDWTVGELLHFSGVRLSVPPLGVARLTFTLNGCAYSRWIFSFTSVAPCINYAMNCIEKLAPCASSEWVDVQFSRCISYLVWWLRNSRISFALPLTDDFFPSPPISIFSCVSMMALLGATMPLERHLIAVESIDHNSSHNNGANDYSKCIHSS